MRRCWRREEVQVSQGSRAPRVPRSKGSKAQGSQGQRYLKLKFKYELDSKEGPSCLKYLSDSVIFYILRCDNWTFSIGSLQILDFELPNIKFNLNNLFHSKLIFCLKDFLSLIFFKSSIHGEICFGTCSVLFFITSKQGIKTLRKPHKTGNIFWRWFMLKTTFSYNEVL